MEILDKTKVALQSPNMELDQSIKHLHDNNITIGEFVTDASSSVRKILGDQVVLLASNKFIVLYHTIATDHPSIHHSWVHIWYKAKTVNGTYRSQLFIVFYHMHHFALPHAFYSLSLSFMQVGKVKNMEKVAQWSRNIVNYFWCSS